MLNQFALLLARILHLFYGYEALNLCFRFMPSRAIVHILRYYGATIGEKVRIQPPFTIHNADQLRPIFQNLHIGNRCYIGRYCIFDLQDRITLEDQVTLSHGVILNTHTHAGFSPLGEKILPQSQDPVQIATGAYLGLRVTVLQGVLIGSKSLIGSNSMVNKNIPAGVLAYGQPCRVQKKLDV